jgi:hypothetical protein
VLDVVPHTGRAVATDGRWNDGLNLLDGAVGGIYPGSKFETRKLGKLVDGFLPGRVFVEIPPVSMPQL